MNFSIRQRIWGSFLILMFIFVVNGIMTITTLNNSKKLSLHISAVCDPLQQYLQDLEALIIESKMYTTNWVFLRSNEDDKEALRNLHNIKYPKVRQQLTELLPKLTNKTISDSLEHVFEDFDQLIVVEKGIMAELSKFEDYDDLIKKMVSEQIVEDDVIPQTTHILSSLNRITSLAKALKVTRYHQLENYSVRIRVFISLLSVFIIGLAVFLSVYFTKVITKPIKKIKNIVNDLGKGIINKVGHARKKDEIGEMINSVNNLSDKLNETARFAHAIGNRDFTQPFTPLSEHDILGTALLTMRDNIKHSEESLLKTSENLIKRNQALEQYTFIVSHNLRAPVATILGLSELLDDENNTREEIKEMLSGLHLSAKKLDAVIYDLNHILEMKQKVHELSETVSLEELVSDVKLIFSKLIEQGNIVFTCNFATAPRITTLKSYLVSILYNLVSNSIKYRRPDIQLVIEIKSYPEGANTVLLYKDNAKGIDMEKNGHKLFGLYERFDLSVEGKGMGLYMIKTQVENLDGNIYVESEIDKGTEFKIVLPGSIG